MVPVLDFPSSLNKVNIICVPKTALVVSPRSKTTKAPESLSESESVAFGAPKALFAFFHLS